MRDTTEIIEDLNHSTEELLETIKKVPAQSFNFYPEENRWSAGDVAQHLLKTEQGTLRILQGETTKAGRDPEENITRIETQFLNFNKKFAAFGPILPDDSPKDQSEIAGKLTEARHQLAKLTVELDLTKLCKAFGHPLFGDLTRVEWIYFTIYHTRRHIHQIKGILQGLPANR